MQAHQDDRKFYFLLVAYSGSRFCVAVAGNNFNMTRAYLADVVAPIRQGAVPQHFGGRILGCDQSILVQRVDANGSRLEKKGVANRNP
jgi:hypothetical protein